MERSPAEEKLLNACWLHDEALVNALLARRPDLAASLPPAGSRQIAHAGNYGATVESAACSGSQASRGGGRRRGGKDSVAPARAAMSRAGAAHGEGLKRSGVLDFGL
jgi:hypothetical protein